MNGMDPNGSNQTGSDQTRLDQKGLDLDALRGRWQASQQPLNEALTLDRAAISKALAGRTAGAFRRHSQRLVPEILLATACLAALIWFTLNHWHDPIYLLAGSVFCLITAADLIVDCRHWRVLSGLDFSQSALLVQSTLERLRARRLALTQWIMLSSVLLWLPAIAVLLKALFGFDLLRSLDSSVVLINSLVGVLFVPLAILLGRFALPRFVGETGMRRFLDELVGMSWTRAQTEWQRQQDGEQALAQGIDPLAAIPPLPAQLASSLRQLRLRLLLACFAFAALILAIGLFNATHGGQWQFLIPGIVLNLLCVSQLVLRILQRLQLKRMDGGMSISQLQQQLDDAAAMGEKVARATLILSPLLALLLAQVLAEASLSVDLFALLGLPGSTAVGVAALALCLVLWRSAIGKPDALLPGFFVHVLSGDSRSLRALQGTLG